MQRTIPGKREKSRGDSRIRRAPRERPRHRRPGSPAAACPAAPLPRYSLKSFRKLVFFPTR